PPIHAPRNQPPIPSARPVSMLKPIRRRQTGRCGAIGIALTGLPPHLARSSEWGREIDAVVLGQVLHDCRVLLLRCSNPRLERRKGKDTALLRHVAVPETAEHRASDLEEA